ncbi:twin-arginine translocase TatA/TatE family subunit [bacterium]|nr:twin-arginine translocase TatA/TatE family subunit [bacterium]
MPLALIVGIGTQELLIIAGILLLIFGATKVPQLMRGFGQGIREFKDAVKDESAAQGGDAKPEANGADKPA